MDLLIDVGNTRAKMAVAEGKEVREELPLEEETVKGVLKRYRVERVMASVVGRMPDFGRLLPNGLSERLIMLSAELPLPIELDYGTPETLGADRIATVVGAHAKWGRRPLLVVDAGSCITIDYLDAGAVYRGGSILPGIGMKFRAMNTFTAKLPLLENKCEGVPLIGRSTEESMRSGVVLGTMLELRGFLEEYRKVEPSIGMILTGGDAEQLAPGLGDDVWVDHSLMWRGLAEVLAWGSY